MSFQFVKYENDLPYYAHHDSWRRAEGYDDGSLIDIF
jgi:hypothetical protein